MADTRDDGLGARRVTAHLLVMVGVAAVLGVVVAGLAIPFAGIAGVGARNVADAMDNLPAELETEALPERTRLLDAKGETIATLYDENRVTVSLSQVSRRMVQAIVAIEDSRYYQHGALDLKGTLRALVTNQANDGVVQGGSSITQQMVKMTLLTQAKTPEEKKAATDDTYARKVKELRYAIAFEQHHSKDWILERYLNIAYFGDGTYGVQSAARHYFGVNAKQLNLRQAAMLAGLVKNPTGYDPTNSPDRALQRRNVVLDRMASLNVITHDQAERTKATGLGLRVVPSRNGCLYSRAPFFCDYAINYLLEDPALGKTVAERRQLLRSGGLTIRTTLDLGYQKAADEAVKGAVDRRDQAVGALAMIEPRTGKVKALAQSRPMGRKEKAGETFLNYAVPTRYGDSAGFQAGSTFKPFVLAAAVEDGIPLHTTFNAPQTKVMQQSEFANCPGAPNFGGIWKVSSSTSSGTMDIYRGTRESVNTFYAMLEQATGVCKPFKIAKALGVELTNPQGDKHGYGAERVPTFTLGIADASPLEMAEAYATFAGRGLHCAARPVTAIADSGGTLLKKYPAKCQQALSESTADAINDVLRGVQEPGGFGYSNGTGMSVPSAAKTGTTQDGKSVWYVGYTPQVATAAMIAGASKDGGRPIRLAGQTIGGRYIYQVSGSGFAGPMWASAMHAIESRLDDVDFVKPGNIAVEGEPVTVPGVNGMSLSEAERTLEAAGFKPIRGGTSDSGYAPGTVARTDPSGGTTLPKGSVVTMYESTGVAPKAPGKGKKGKKGKGRGPRGGGR